MEGQDTRQGTRAPAARCSVRPARAGSAGPDMRFSSALILICALAAVVWLVAEEASSLASAVGTLRERLAATDLARREAQLLLECEAALWPNIPDHCLQRIITRE
jgi:hypothetical protein